VPSGPSGPVYNTNQLNSLPTITFTASSTECLVTSTTAIASGNTTMSYFLVLKKTASGASSGRWGGFRANGQSKDYDNIPSAVLLATSSNTGFYQYRNNGFVATDTNTNNYAQYGSIFDGTNGTIYVSNVASTSVASTGSFGATGELTVGCSDQGGINTDYLDASYAEIVLTKSALSSTDRSNINTYFLSRWGV
jgi:hypothetical protein